VSLFIAAPRSDVHGEPGSMPVTRDAVGKQLGRQVLALLRSHHPADDVAAEQIDDHVRVQKDALLQRCELGISHVHTWLDAVAVERGFDVRVRTALISALFDSPNSASTR